MARIEIYNQISNQKNTPSFWSDVFVNRPPFGFAGRIFFATDTQQIFQDTGTGWILIAGAGQVSNFVGTTSNAAGDFNLTFTSNGVLLLIGFVPTLASTIDVGSIPGGIDIYNSLTCPAGIQTTLLISYPYTSLTNIYITGIVSPTIYNLWQLQSAGY